jgi:hypothetical protein
MSFCVVGCEWGVGDSYFIFSTITQMAGIIFFLIDP